MPSLLRHETEFAMLMRVACRPNFEATLLLWVTPNSASRQNDSDGTRGGFLGAMLCEAGIYTSYMWMYIGCFALCAYI